MANNSERNFACYQILSKLSKEHGEDDDVMRGFWSSECTCGGAESLSDALDRDCRQCIWKHLHHLQGGMPTTMMKEAERGHVNSVRVLSSRQKGMKDADGHTALWYTTFEYSERHLECYKFLRSLKEERETADQQLIDATWNEEC